MTDFPNIKVEDTRYEGQQTQNIKPFAICLTNPEPIVRAYIIKVLTNNVPVSLDYNVVKQSGAVLEQNTPHILRILLKEDANLFKSHLEIDYKRWVSVQERFGLVPGIIKKIENDFKSFDAKKNKPNI